MTGNKNPVSVLVLIHSPALEVLLLERAMRPGFWQSVTGSQEGNESLRDTARREVGEETGIVVAPENISDWCLENRYEIFAEWRHRYPEGITHNREHVFSLCVPRETFIVTAPLEHLGYLWLPWREAADKVFSWTNRDAILLLPSRYEPSCPSS
ncbi:MAG: dihydroneopterin triphosphate diphosphatase [Sterolibacterium sp.]